MPLVVQKYKNARKVSFNPSDAARLIHTCFTANELSELSGKAERYGTLQIWTLRESGVPRLVYSGKPDSVVSFLENSFSSLEGQNYYLTKNCFTGHVRQYQNVFSYHTIVIDVDDHGNCRTTEHLRWQKSALFHAVMQAQENELLAASLPPVTAIVDTGRGLQLWFSFDGISSKNSKAYERVQNQLVDSVSQICDSLSEEYSDFCLETDKAASKNGAGLCRLPGTVNTKTKSKAALLYLNAAASGISFWGETGFSSFVLDNALLHPVSQAAQDSLPLRRRNSSHKASSCPCVADSVLRLFKLRNYDKVPAAGERDLFVYVYYNNILQRSGKELAWIKTKQLNQMFSDPFSETELKNHVLHIGEKITVIENPDGTKTKIPGYRHSLNYIIKILHVTPEEIQKVGLFPKCRHTDIAKVNTKPVHRQKRERLLQEERNRARIMAINHPDMTVVQIANFFGKSRKWASTCVNSSFEGELSHMRYQTGTITKKPYGYTSSIWFVADICDADVYAEQSIVCLACFSALLRATGGKRHRKKAKEVCFHRLI